MFLLWTVVTFLVGAVPFAVWIGRYGLHKEITQYGDGNPGATNVLRAGNAYWFALALLLEISKGAAPVGVAYYLFGWQDWRVLPVALAGPLGHTFSPFWGWQRGKWAAGGKSVAAAFGVWIGLTLWQMPLVALVALLLWSWLIRPAGWAVMGALSVMLLALGLWLQDPLLLGVWVGQGVLLAWTHRADLRQRPRWRLGWRLGRG